jgi:hypothetical protein
MGAEARKRDVIEVQYVLGKRVMQPIKVRSKWCWREGLRRRRPHNIECVRNYGRHNAHKLRQT